MRLKQNTSRNGARPKGSLEDWYVAHFQTFSLEVFTINGVTWEYRLHFGRGRMNSMLEYETKEEAYHAALMRAQVDAAKNLVIINEQLKKLEDKYGQA